MSEMSDDFPTTSERFRSYSKSQLRNDTRKIYIFYVLFSN